ncbi:hypothetical protein J4456_04285 [Candidatus Pacearchaeota archaeon]|nr:hypothetical protein [Candidatus Pacearchaeota archaeon]
MKREVRDLILVIISLIVIIIVGLIIWMASQKQIAVGSLGNCTILRENPGNKKINIVFFTDNSDESEINEQIDFFLSVEPYNNHKEKFNFYFTGKTECGLASEALFCYSRDLIKRSAVCPNDYIVVLSEEAQKLRSSSYMSVLSINTNHPSSVFLHEFGHAFANLADEYIPSVIPTGSKNCVASCDALAGYECHEGCSKSFYFRSSDESVMKSLRTNDYKELNREIIEEHLNEYD